MKVVLQRVECASVAIDGKTVGEINQGLLIFLGVGAEDTKEMADKMLNKIKKLRIFADSDDKTNLSIEDVDGEILVISQFTLYANCKKGNRPSFTQAGNQALATELYEYFLSICHGQFKKVACGEFGADMKISLINDGPFTIVLDSSEIC